MNSMGMPRLWLLSFFLLSGLNPLCFTAAPPQGAPDYFRAFRSHETKENLTRVELRNGLVLITEEHPSLPLLAVVTHLRMGVADVGRFSAHAYGELIGATLDREAQEFGGVVRWHVQRDRIDFVTLAPSDEIRDALAGQIALFEDQPFAGRSFEISAAVERIREEIRTSSAHPFSHLSELVFERGPAGGEPLPTAESLQEIHEDYFHTENVVLSVTGRVRYEVVLEDAAELAGKLPVKVNADQGNFGKDSTSPGEGSFRYRQRPSQLPDPFVALAFRMPNFRHPDHLTLRLIQYVLGKGYGTPLRLPREDEEVLPFRSSSIQWRESAAGDLLEVRVLPVDSAYERAESRVLGAFRALATTNVPALLLKRAKALFASDYLVRMEDLGERARLLAEGESLGDYTRRDTLLARVAAVTPERLREVAGRYFGDDGMALIEYLPEGAEPRDFTSTTFLETLQILVPSEVRSEAAFLEVFREIEVDPYEVADFEPTYSGSSLRRSSILRGPEMYLRETHWLPLVHLGFFYPGGRVSEGPEDVGVTELLLRAVPLALTRLDSGLQMVELEAGGGRIETVNEPDFFGWRLTFHSSATESSFERFVSWIRADTEIIEADLERARGEIRREVMARGGACDPLEEAYRRVRAELFGDHPYSRVARPLCGGSPSQDLRAVRNWQGRHLVKTHPYIVVSGDVAGTSFLQRLISDLSDASYRVKDPVEADLSYPADEWMQTHSAENWNVTLFEGPDRESDYREMLDVMETIFSGAGGQLLQEFRGEEESLLLDLELDHLSFLEGGLVRLAISAPEEKLEEARTKVLNRIRSFSESRIDPSDFLSSLVGTITRFHLRQNHGKEYLIETMTTVLSGQPVDYARRYRLNVQQFRIGEIETVISRFFGEVDE